MKNKILSIILAVVMLLSMIPLTGMAVYAADYTTVPTAPQYLTAANTGDSKVNLSWKAPESNGNSPLLNYFIYYKTASGNSWNLLQATGTNVTLSSLSEGVTYQFKITALNSVGESDFSNTETIVYSSSTAQAPVAPVITQAYATDGGIFIKWSPSANTAKYRLYFKPHIYSQWSLANATYGENGIYIEGSKLGLINGVAYDIKMQAVSPDDQTSPESDIVTITPAITPSIPTDLTSTYENGNIKLNWTEPKSNGGSAIEQYNVYYKAITEADWKVKTSTTTSIIFDNLTNGNVYKFKVKACNAMGESDASDVIKATKTSSIGRPSAPTEMQIMLTNNGANVIYNPPENDGGSKITGYKLHLTTPGLDDTYQADADELIKGYILENNVTYNITLTALNASGESDPVTASFTTVSLDSTPAIPSIFSCEPRDKGFNVTIKLPENNGGHPITDYNVMYRKTGTQDWTTTTKNVPVEAAENGSYYYQITVNGLINDTTYEVKLTVGNSKGTSGDSNTATVTPKNTSIPSRPVGVSAHAHNNAVALKWGEYSTATSYQIQYKATDSNDWLTETSATTSQIISGLENGKAYDFRIVGINNYGSSLISETVNCTPKAVQYEVKVVNGTDETGASPYTAGTQVSIKATVPDGKNFEKWESSFGGTFANEKSDQTTFTMPPRHYVTLTPSFIDKPIETTYELKVENGTGSGTFAEGATVNIKANTFADGMAFDYWESDNGGVFGNVNSAETTFTMPKGDVKVTAHYKQVQKYTLTIVDGSTADGATSETFAAGTTVNIKANAPAEGMIFDYWESDNGNDFGDVNSAETTFIMPKGDARVTAHYKQVQKYTLTIVDGTTADGATSEQVADGTTVNIKANAPADGMYFSTWESSNGVIFQNPNASETSFVMPASDTTITAVYKTAQAWTDDASLYDTSWYAADKTEFTLTTPEQLAGLSALVQGANGLTQTSFSNQTVKLGNDIDVSKYLWTTIGLIGEYNGDQKPFLGTFDGTGNTISGVTIQNDDRGQGLFGCSHGTIKNVGVVNATIKGGKYSGIVCGENQGTITNCYSTNSTINGKEYIAGICGYNNGTVKNCNNNSTVIGNDTSYTIGGICGVSYNTIENCTNFGTITGKSNIGGICGSNYSSIKNCYNTGEIKGNTSVGGVCGRSEIGTMESCTNAGTISGENGIGGINGANRSSVINCYNTGEIKGVKIVGGVCGYNSEYPQTGAIGTITNCYSTGNVSGNSEVGGVAGLNYILISDCFFTGNSVGVGFTAEGATSKVTPFITLAKTDVNYLDSTVDATIASDYSVLKSAFGDNFSFALESISPEQFISVGANQSIDVVFKINQPKLTDNGWSATETDEIKGVSSLNGITVNKLPATDVTTPDGLTTVYDSLKTLADVQLPAGWAWTDTTIKPAIQNSGYSAYYTVTDDTNYDWSGIDGYNEETHCVTRMVNLSVTPRALGTKDVTIEGVNDTYTVSDKPITPIPVVKLSSVTLDSNIDYDVAYSNNTAVGTATITISFKGNYTGTADKTFEIAYGTVTDDMILMPETNKNGWFNKNIVITPDEGYTISDSVDGVFSDLLTIDTESTKDGTSTTIYLKNANNEIFERTIAYQLDKTNPNGKIEIGTNSFKEFLKNITFGLFFKDTQSVTISANDNESGVDLVEYYISNQEVTDVNQIKDTDWQKYENSFSIEPNDTYVIYAKITDKAGNSVVINSNGLVLDNIFPKIDGIEDGQSYYQDMTFTFSDAYLDYVIVNNEPINIAVGSYTIKADNKQHTIIAADKAGNQTTYTISVYKTYAVTYDSAAGYTIQPQNSSASPVNYNGSFSFKLIIDKNYEDAEDFAVKVNDTAINADTDGVYCINNITSPQAITVQGVVLKGADYSKVDKAIEAASALNAENYTNFDTVTTAINAVERDKNITEQNIVDSYADAINKAIGELSYKGADYSKVDKAIEAASAVNAKDYTNFDAVTTAINAVERNKNITEQNIVDGYADAINKAIGELSYKGADYSKVDKAIEAASALNAKDYTNFDAVTTAINAVERNKNITEQNIVDGYADAINKAIKELKKKPADNTSSQPNNSSNTSSNSTSSSNTNTSSTTTQSTSGKKAEDFQTGDSTNSLPWLALLLVSSGVLTTLYITGKKRKVK